MNNQLKWPHLFCRYYQLIFMVFFVTLLSGCGGASGSNDITNPTVGAKLSVQMTNNSGQTITTAEAGSIIIVKVTATNDFGNNASGITVSLATDRGTLSQDNALTNNQGIAEASLITSNSQIGVAVVTATATVDGKELTRTGQVELTEVVITTPNINVTAFEQTCTDQITIVEAGKPVCLKTSVYNGTQAITNQVVEYSATQGIPTPASSLTNSSGVATTTIVSTTDLLGASILSASAQLDGTTYSNSTNIEYSAFIPDDLPDPVVNIDLFDDDCTTQSNTAKSTESLCVIINLSQNSQPLNNEIIQLDAPVGTLRQTSGLTNANGNFVTYIDSIVRETGASTLTVTFNNFSAQQNYQFVPFTTNTSTLTLNVFDESCDIEQNTITAGFSLCFQATLMSNDQPVSNAIIDFEAPLGNLRQITALTNDTGVAQAIIDSESTTIGAAIVTASHDGITTTENYQFSESPTQNQTKITLTVRDSNCQNLTTETEAGTPLCLIANITENDEPKAGQLFTFNAPIGNLDPESALSDEQGNGRVILNSATTDIGAGTATVTYEQFVQSANYEFIRGNQTQPTSLNIQIKDQNCVLNVTAAAQGDPLCIQAQLIGDEGGIKDAIIEFSTPLGVFEPSSALTDALGIATVSLQTANSELGAAEILATHSNLTDTASFQIIVANSSRNLVLDTYRNDCTTLSSSFGAGSSYCLVALLTESGSPIANEIVTFETPIGELRQFTALTDTSGTARVIANTNSTNLGAGAALANNDNLTAQANFEVIASDDSSTARPEITLVSTQDGEVTNSFKANETIQIEATLIDELKNPIPNTIIRYSVELGQLASTSALTDSAGKAQVTLGATVSDIGAAAATATAIVNGVTYAQTHNYQILNSDSVELNTAKIGYFDENNNFINGQIGISITDTNANAIPDLSAGGTIGLNVVVVSQSNERINTPVTVTFTSTCVNQENSTIDLQVTTVSGEANSTYEDLTCATANGNQDTIVATITANNIAVIATRTIELLPDDIGSIEFVSAEPTSIVLKGTGGQGKQETSTLTYSVKSLLGNPVSQQPVSFALESTIGGLSVSPSQSLTNSQGLVTTIVRAGNVPTAVRVSATTEVTEGSSITTQSDLLSVNTGLPDQNSITLASEQLNPEANSFTGVQVGINAYMADSFNNPVPNGTTVNFTTEGGFIQPSCNTINGHCRVLWTGTNPRVANHRITILATAIGHETFFDVNGNNVFDNEDTPNGQSDAHDQGTDSGLGRGEYRSSGFVDHSEAWRDDDEDGIHDAGELFIDYNNDNNFNAADGKFNGPQCIHDSMCGGENASRISVRKALVMIMSGSSAAYTVMTEALTSTANQNTIPHVGTRYVLATNDDDTTNGTDENVLVDGGISIALTGNASSDSNNLITLEEDQSLPIILALSDQAAGFGQTLPAGSIVTISTNAGSIIGSDTTIISDQQGINNPNDYGGDYINFSIVNTNSTNSDGDTNLTGQITISIVFPSSESSQVITLPVRMIGR